MDFKKIGHIFIVTFLLLNLYLIYGILERKDIQQTSSQENQHNILESMEEMDILLPDLAEESVIDEKEVYSIQADGHDLLEKEMEDNEIHEGTLNEDDVYYTSFPSNPISLKGNPEDGFKKEDYESIEEFVLSEQIMFGSEYTGIEYDADGRRFLLYQHVDGLPIIDGSSEIALFVNEEGEIYSYQQTYAGPISRQGQELDLIDAKRAIELLFINNEIREGFEIKKPTLAYHRALYLEDLSMYSPVWSINVVRSSEKETFRVDAVNGTIIRQQAASQSETPKKEEAEEEDEEGIKDSE